MSRDEMVIRTDDGIIRAEVTALESGHDRPDDGARLSGAEVDYHRTDDIEADTPTGELFRGEHNEEGGA